MTGISAGAGLPPGFACGIFWAWPHASARSSWASSDALRYEPIDKRIRATLGDRTVVDSTRAVLVWEPKRVVPSYAVPAGDIDAELGARGRSTAATGVPATGAPQLGGRPVLRPERPVRGPHRRRRAGDVARRRRARPAALPPADDELDGYVRARLRGLRRLVRGGRAQRRPPARPVPPDRHRPQLAPRAGRARRRRARRVHAARTCCSSRRCRSATTCRADDVAPDLLRAERHPHHVRVQGPGVVPGRCRTPTTSPGPTPSRCARRPR